MARGVNKVILVGNLGRDPEVRYLANGSAVANVTIATSDSWKDKTSGEKQERTEWHTVVFFGRLAEIAGEYLKKGSQVYVEGGLRTRKWQDKEGRDRYSTEVVASEMRMLGSARNAPASSQQNAAAPAAAAPAAAPAPAAAAAPAAAPAAAAPAAPAVTPSPGGNFDDDIPF